MSVSKILITGASGFVGSHLIDHLLESGYTAQQIYGTSYGEASEFLKERLPADHIYQLDLTDESKTLEVFTSVNPDEIYHLASVASVGDSFERAAFMLQNNTSLQLSVLDAVHSLHTTRLKEKRSIPKLLVVSSAAVYAASNEKIDESGTIGPSNPYAVSKATQDFLAQNYADAFDMDIRITRSFNHTGPRQAPNFAIPAFAQQIVQIERGEQDALRVGNLEAVRDICDVRDVVKAYSLIMQNGMSGEIYNVGAGRERSMQSYLDQLIEHSEADITIKSDPSRMRPSDTPYSSCDSGKLESLGWKPEIDFATTVLDTLKYWRNNS